MPFINSATQVQLEYPDFHGRGFPGQYFRESDSWNYKSESFPVDTGDGIFCGRLVVQAVAQSDAVTGLEGTLPTNAPFSVRSLIITDTTTSLYVGLVLRSFVGNLNLTTEGDVRKAGFAEKSIAPIVPLGSDAIIIVRQEPGLSVTHGDDVYVATDPTNDANINPGEFSNAAGTNLVLIPGAIWWETKNATDIDAVGSVRLK